MVGHSEANFSENSSGRKYDSVADLYGSDRKMVDLDKDLQTGFGEL